MSERAAGAHRVLNGMPFLRVITGFIVAIFVRGYIDRHYSTWWK
jgi:hypothetical protein